MNPETKFALLMVGLFLLFPISVFATHALHRFLSGNGLAHGFSYNNPWEFSPVRKPLFGEQQK